MTESPQKFFEQMCEEMADRVTLSKRGDVVSLGCEDNEHATRVFSLLERLGDAAEAFGFFEVTNGREPRKESPPERAEIENNEYLLQNCSAGYVGNSPMFWKKGGSGYTPWIDDAQRWTKEAAEFQIRSTRGTHEWKMWSVAEIESVARRTVDIQDLRKLVESHGETA